MTKVAVHFAWKDRAVTGRFRTGVSLHSHTCRSWENLSWLSGYATEALLLPTALKFANMQHRHSTGEDLDLTRTFWTPPLGVREAFLLESRQIQDRGFFALVSLSDHDDIEAGLSLAGCCRPGSTAASIEWTVPFGPTFFHIGVHNLPPAQARTIASWLVAYTSQPKPHNLPEILHALDGLDDTLLVLNHPLWDEAGIGADAHRRALDRLLEACGDTVHAVELNGLRSWRENCDVLELAGALRRPAISGGDRHGLEPNAIVNLTNADTFPGFVAEIRRDRFSQMLFMHQYREPLRLRWMETVRDIFRSYQDASGRRVCWSDRFFYECESGGRQPLSKLWKDTRWLGIGAILAVIRASEWPTVQPALRLALADRAGTVPA